MIELLFVSSLFFQALIPTPSNAQYAAAEEPGGSTCVTPNGANGVCIGIRRCSVLMNILETRPLPPGAVEFLKQSQCGFEGKDPRVCCPTGGSTPPRGDNQNETNNMGTDSDSGVVGDDLTASSYDLSNNPLLPTECGKDLTQRIFGGETTDIDEFPWMALLEYAKPNGRTTACGGVLIGKRYVLTAAHCVKGKDLPKTWSLENVRLGEYDTNTNPDCIRDGRVILVCADEPVTVGVEEQIAHENYRPNSKDQKYDIALLRLTRDVSFTNYVKPICLPPNAAIGEKLYAAGWGKTENRTASNVKLKVSLPRVEKEQCQTTYANAGVNLGVGQICAGGQKGKDSCRGDSGGPLMTLERTREGTGKWSVVGVVSFGPSPCGMPGWPGVYTKVSDFVPWILSKMKP